MNTADPHPSSCAVGTPVPAEVAGKEVCDALFTLLPQLTSLHQPG